MSDLADRNTLSLVWWHASNSFGYSLHVQWLALRCTGTLVSSNEVSDIPPDSSAAAMKPKGVFRLPSAFDPLRGAMDAHLSLSECLEQFRTASRNQLLYLAHVARRYPGCLGDFGSNIYAISSRQI
jgi:hypothetical protein